MSRIIDVICCFASKNKHHHHRALVSYVAMVDQKHSWVLAMNNHPIESWDLSIPSLALHCSLTKVPSGQWLHDFGSSGIMRLTYFGQTLAGVQRFHIRMVSEGKSWVVARMDNDGNWMTNDEQALEVTLTPTILNVLARLTTLETSAYANVSAASHAMQDTEKRLVERVGTLEEQGKRLGGLSDLVNTLHHHCAESSKKFDAAETKLGELAESLRNLRDSVANDALNRKCTSAEANTIHLEATTEQLKRDLESVKEKMHYTLVKKENDDDDDVAEQIALLKGTLGKCLLQQSELQQSAAGLTKSVTSMQQELTKLVAQEVVDLSPEVTKAHLGPGETPQCRCKRLRR